MIQNSYPFSQHGWRSHCRQRLAQEISVEYQHTPATGVSYDLWPPKFREVKFLFLEGNIFLQWIDFCWDKELSRPESDRIGFCLSGTRVKWKVKREMLGGRLKKKETSPRVLAKLGSVNKGQIHFTSGWKTMHLIHRIFKDRYLPILCFVSIPQQRNCSWWTIKAWNSRILLHQ